MKAVIYARFSSEKQNEASIEGQLRECMDYANFNNIEVIGNYIDRAQSAKTDNRCLEARPLCPKPLRFRLLQEHSQKERRARYLRKGEYLAGRGRHFA